MFMGAPAQAAVVYGDVAQASFSTGSQWPVDDRVSCAVSGYWQSDPDASPASTVVLKGKCTTGYNIASADLFLSVEQPGCAFGLEVGEVDGAGDWTKSYSPSCTMPVTELCYKVTTSNWSDFGQGSKEREDCVPWALGAPPAAAANGSCAGFSSTAPHVVSAQAEKNGSGYTFMEGVAFHVDQTVAATYGWLVYAVYDSTHDYNPANSANNLPVPSGQPGVGSMAERFTTTVIPATAGSADALVYAFEGAQVGQEASAVKQRNLVGFGFYKKTSSASTVSYTFDAGTGLVGLTDPARCAFYWGAKIVDRTADSLDEPMGPLTVPSGDPTPPVVEDPVPPAGDGSCDGFSFTDPASWAGAGICVLVKMVGGLIDTVAALPGKIMGLLGDLLESLFVPEDGFLDDRMESIRGKLQGSSPGLYASSVTQLVAGPSVAGCSGVPVHFDLGLGDDSVDDVDFTLGAACAGDELHTAAGICRLVLACGLILSGGLLCVRLVGGSLVPELKELGRGGGDTA
ncbi:hypothetical protein SAMN04487968_1166 [Nocardioides terrae]|uniref:Uncharacterized protein n=2 Tax=Nocardioides terrae TaxID=574651 RepID=A0A1I1NHK2_9ACTN|nr:hypothetical protein SAMN04487968_1166 [Nocardioides terrae]